MILRLALLLIAIAAVIVLGTISDPVGAEGEKVKSRYSGVVIGYTNNPLIHLGDAMVHVGEAKAV